MPVPDGMTGQWVGVSRPHIDQAPFPPVIPIIVNIEADEPSRATLLGGGLNDRGVAEADVDFKNGEFIGTTKKFQYFDQIRDDFFPYRNDSGPPIPSKAKYVGKLNESVLKGTFINDLDGTGDFELSRDFTLWYKNIGTMRKQTLASWEAFKNEVSKLGWNQNLLFRGHKKASYKLQTSFHRRRRLDLVRYVTQHFAQFTKEINATLQEAYFDVQKEHDFLALLNLAQHHGYPTPLLDWTESPFVAAFFAFGCDTEDASEFMKEAKCDGKCICDKCGSECKCEKKVNEEDRYVRVICFDRSKWLDWDKFSLKDPFPNVQFRRPPSRLNPRFYPQQSWASFSNMCDIETLILGEVPDKEILRCFDIPRSERRKAECDLRYMGITAATMFPGIEGICKSHRMRYFD